MWPLKLRIIKINPYNIPLGTVLEGRRKDGDASPFPYECYHREMERTCQFTSSEVEEVN